VFDHSQGVLLEPPTTDLDLLANGTSNEITLQGNEALRDLPIVPDRCDPEVDADSELSLHMVLCGIEDMPERIPSPNSWLMHEEQTAALHDEDRSSPSQGAFNLLTELESDFSSSLITPDASSKNFPEVRDGVNSAALLLAEGSYEQAFGLYSHWLKVTWGGRMDPETQPFLVSLVAGMSLSASTLPEVLDAGSKMNQLIAIRDRDMWGGSRTEVILSIYLAILLLRHQWMYEAWEYLEHSLELINHLWVSGRPAFGDWRATANILYQSAKLFPHGFCSSSSREFSTQLKYYRTCLVGVEHEHDKLLQPLSYFCVSMLEMAGLKSQLAYKLGPCSSHGRRASEIKSTLHRCLLRHFWHTFAMEESTFPGFVETSTTYGFQELSEIMQVGSVDLFAAIALALMNMTSPLPDEPEQRSGTDKSNSAWPGLLLKHIHGLSLGVVARKEYSGYSDYLMDKFLSAHTSITLTRVTDQSPPASADPQSSFVRESLRMPAAFESSIQDCPGRVALRTEHPTESEDVSPKIQGKECFRSTEDRRGIILRLPLRIDPPLNPTPKSSGSSGFRSMLSLHRHIKDAGIYGGSTASPLSVGMDWNSDHRSHGGSPEYQAGRMSWNYPRESW
jgi:hypothetical protein